MTMKHTYPVQYLFFLPGLVFCTSVTVAQSYPNPEFTNEVYFLKKETPYSLVRLEKSSAKQENKVNMLKGSEFGYEIEGKTSPVRFTNGSSISFIYTAATSSSSNSRSDSMMRANGMDPNAMSGLGNDPASMITLYKLNLDGGSRKIYMQKTGGYFGNHKNGYWELVVDKPLPKGEYAFSMMGMGMDMSGSRTLFAFGID